MSLEQISDTDHESPYSYESVTILDTATLSDAVDLWGFSLVGIELPAAVNFASLTLQVSSDGTTYKTLTDMAGADITVTVAASKVVAIPPSTIPYARYLKVTSDIATDADTVIKMIVAQILGEER